ncbi:184_t:CDS:2 [Funneliformis caledonium]|uniref:184_t:CDS:1 n=1 Tax=Funneliformis caledonium TaxID=1117310 RepID=A0A9N9GMH0_9GLOM|nr:184_t:CDS:2 [Funneliformis caledonium]
MELSSNFSQVSYNLFSRSISSISNINYTSIVAIDCFQEINGLSFKDKVLYQVAPFDLSIWLISYSF